MKSIARLGVAVTATAALATAAMPAYAQTGTASSTSTTAPTTRTAGLKGAQTLADARIDGRLQTLHALNTAIGSATRLASADRSTLSSLIGSDISGLTALRTKVGGETTVAGVRADETAMVDVYRVYMLVAPKVRLATVFDIEATAGGTLQRVHDKLAARLAKQSGGGSADEKARLADLQSQIQAAQQAASGKVAALLAIQPSPDATAIRSALSPLVTAAKSARRDLVQARDDAKTLRSELKADPASGS
ncbi:MAG: hypothetical protein ACRDVE_15260 [Actinocrinis sp.]